VLVVVVVVVVAVVCAVAVVVVVGVDVGGGTCGCVGGCADGGGVVGRVGSGRREERGTRRGARREESRVYKTRRDASRRRGVEASGSGGAGAAWEYSALPNRRQLPEGRIPAAPLPRCPAAPPACLCSLLHWPIRRRRSSLARPRPPRVCPPRVSLPVPSCRPTRR